MAYTKQTWVTGDIVTAEKLNHIEDGISNSAGVLYIPVTMTEIPNPGDVTQYTYSSDYSYNDIAYVIEAGKFPIVTVERENKGVLMTAYFPLLQSMAETEEVYGAFGFMASGESICFNSDGTIDTQPHQKQQEEPDEPGD